MVCSDLSYALKYVWHLFLIFIMVYIMVGIIVDTVYRRHIKNKTKKTIKSLIDEMDKNSKK